MKKFFKISLILFVFFILISTTFVSASGINMNLSGNNSGVTNSSDETVYGSNSNTNSNSDETSDGQENTNVNSNIGSQIPINSSASLSSSNLELPTIINIILIVLGILLILLGIAILIRLR